MYVSLLYFFSLIVGYRGMLVFVFRLCWLFYRLRRVYSLYFYGDGVICLVAGDG